MFISPFSTSFMDLHRCPYDGDSAVPLRRHKSPSSSLSLSTFSELALSSPSSPPSSNGMQALKLFRFYFSMLRKLCRC
ncbi:hypothetical protein Lalb_Chr12g0205991 [Lupinus albus]|uniref:Uncharacterized protein n=1 Tax=Lupinus albus TaxID=3870 RepID=A0A6A4PN76_LUPAL|nr:hypothetical protein Lalb_Chr12g0205991 [Lupinus albus]